MAVNISELKKAIVSLKDALDRNKDDITRDASIQRFEFCIELAWKNAKKIMGTTTTAPKQVIREMGQNNLITNVSLWLEAIDKRNLSSHTYNEDLAEDVYQFAKSFLSELTHLQKNLEEK